MTLNRYVQHVATNLRLVSCAKQVDIGLNLPCVLLRGNLRTCEQTIDTQFLCCVTCVACVSIFGGLRILRHVLNSFIKSGEDVIQW